MSAVDRARAPTAISSLSTRTSWRRESFPFQLRVSS
jgi:hypothetical protein